MPKNAPSVNAESVLYFDHAAAVPVSPETLDRFRELSLIHFANQEASGAHGKAAADALSLAEKQVLSAFALDPLLWRVFPAFSGTSAIRIGLRSAVSFFPNGGTILYSDAEHASVRTIIHSLPDFFRPVRIPLKKDGLLDVESFAREASKKNVILACVSAVQPETGVIQNLPILRKILKNAAPKALFFCDSIQAAGKIPFFSCGAEPDLFTVSGQKIGTPGGAFLVLKNNLFPIASVQRTDLHEADRVPPAFSLLLAERLTELQRTLTARAGAMRAVKQELLTLLAERIPGQFSETVPAGSASPYILHLLLNNNVQGAIVVRALAAMGISVASGSACDAETDEPSRVLSAMKIGRQESFGALRLSFFEPVPSADLVRLAEALQKVLREY